MHWLTKWRRNFERPDGGRGLSREELAYLVRQSGTGCSYILIGVLENGGITHPRIANKIARITGATEKQRNGMVHKKHWDGYKPLKPLCLNIPHKPKTVSPPYASMRPVVQLSANGEEMGRFTSLRQAADKEGANVNTVIRRCKRQISFASNEFAPYYCTWRYADDWDSMDAAERLMDMKRAQGHKRETAKEG